MKVQNAHATTIPRLRTYAAPQLVHLGTLRDLTLGGGTASGEAGNPRIKKKA